MAKLPIYHDSFGQYKPCFDSRAKIFVCTDTCDVVTIPIIAGVDLLVCAAQKRFRIVCRRDVAEETMSHCLYDLVAPKLLSGSEQFVLHGGLVCGRQGALGFYGPSGRGKSTLTTSLSHQGFDLMGDDAIIFETDSDIVFAGRLYASLRLKPDSFNHLFNQPQHTTTMAGYSDKRRVHIPDTCERAPLQALFFLDEPTDAIYCKRLAASDALISLTTHSFVLDPEDIAETKSKFQKAARVVQNVPVFRLTYPRDYARLAEVHTAIFETLGIHVPEATTI